MRISPSPRKNEYRYADIPSNVHTGYTADGYDMVWHGVRMLQSTCERGNSAEKGDYFIQSSD